MDGNEQGTIATICAVIFALFTLWQKIQAVRAQKDVSKLDTALRIAVIGAEELARLLPKATAKQTKGEIKAMAERAGVEDVLHKAVVAETKPDEVPPPPPVLRPQPPKLPAILLALVLAVSVLAGASGCVSQRIHESALQLEASWEKYRAATELPQARKEYFDKGSPFYDPGAAAKVPVLEAEVTRAIKAVQEASK